LNHSENNPPLLSIIIPTRNRYKYAISAIISILQIPEKNFELIIQDNSNSTNLKEYIYKNINDSRLKYHYYPTPLSFIDNFNEALEHASGKYCCIIGDDDGVNPEIFEATRWAEQNNIDAIKPTVSAHYLWPESDDIPSIDQKAKTKGNLTIYSISGKTLLPDPDKEMLKVVQRGGIGYNETEIPRLYHGIVKRECLMKVKNATGAFFGGLSPDIFIAIGVANFSKNIISIDYPLTISGVCKSSGSSQSVRGEHVGNLKDAPHFRNRGEYEWAEIVPAFYSVETIWADSMIHALNAINRNDLIEKFDLYFFSAHCLVSHFEYNNIILNNLYANFKIIQENTVLGTIRLIISFLLDISLRARRFIKKALFLIFFNVERFDDINNMVEATKKLSDYLKEKNIKLMNFIS